MAYSLQKRKEIFLNIFLSAYNFYKNNMRRLAAQGWKYDWQILISTIMSAQSRDETTIPIAEKLFSAYPKLSELGKATQKDVFEIIKSINYNKTKAKNVVLAAKYLINHNNKKVPNEMEELLKIPGVGRKTANLIMGEVFNKQGICVDTHVHRIANVFGIVNTKTPDKTEIELMKIAPKKYWNKINRTFVLWGQDVKGYDKEKFLEHIK